MRVVNAFSQPATGSVAGLRYRVAFGSQATRTSRAKETKQGRCPCRATRPCLSFGATRELERRVTVAYTHSSSVRASAGNARSLYGRKTVTNHRGTLPHTYSATTLVNHWGEIRPTWHPIAAHGWANAGVSHLFYQWECSCSGCCESPHSTTANVVGSAKNVIYLPEARSNVRKNTGGDNGTALQSTHWDG